MRILVLALSTLLLVQDSEQDQKIADLVEKLESDSVVDRESASEELRKVGTAALPQLREVAKTGSAEAKTRAEEIIRTIELAEKVKVVHPGIKVLYASGYTDDEIVRREIMTDDRQFTMKPFTPHTLANKVRESLDRLLPVG